MRENTVKSRIKKAVSDLLEKKRYTEISITDVVREANVARASFYRSFNNIDEVLDSIIEDLKFALFVDTISQIKKIDKESEIEMLRDFLTQVKNKTIPLMNSLFINHVYIMSRLENSFLYNEEKRGLDRFEIPTRISVIYIVTFIWATEGYKESPIEMANYLYDNLVKLGNAK